MDGIVRRIQIWKELKKYLALSEKTDGRRRSCRGSRPTRKYSDGEDLPLEEQLPIWKNPNYVWKVNPVPVISQ
ncbi:MAG: hypothetical protein ACLVEJ_16225 [Parabacteroides sp.]